MVDGAPRRRRRSHAVAPAVAASEVAAAAPGAAAVVTKGERTRQVLLAAAIARFGRDGYRATSVAEIARDAGLSSTAAYPYFPNKEALFVAAADEDAAGVIDEGLMVLLREPGLGWIGTLVPSLLGALDHHPLARRVLGGLEPDFTVRLLGIPALEQLRKEIADRVAVAQHAGIVRGDVDVQAMAEGLITIVLSILMSLVQTRADPDVLGVPQVLHVFAAALTTPPR